MGNRAGTRAQCLTGVPHGAGGRFGSAADVGQPAEQSSQRPDAEIGVVGDLQRAAAGALGEAAPRVRLDAPGDAAEQELLVIRARLLAEDLSIFLLELYAVVRCRRASISQWISVSFFMALTGSHMRALCLRKVNWRGEKQADKCIGENGGDFADGFVERGVAFAHERSPCPRSPKASCAVRK